MGGRWQGAPDRRDWLQPTVSALVGRRAGGEHNEALVLLTEAGDDGRYAARQLSQLLRFKAPALYDDEIVVRTRLTNIRPYLLRFQYEVLRASDRQLLAKGETTHFIVDEKFKITRLPQKYLTAFAQASSK